MRKKRSDALPDEVRAAARKAAYAKYRASHPDRVRTAQATYRHRNRERIASLTASSRENKKAFVAGLKSAPCADCGGLFPPYCMDFDHRPGEEKHDRLTHKGSGYKRIPVAVSALSVEQIKAEAAKCDVVCANCHRKRTHLRRCGDHKLG